MALFFKPIFSSWRIRCLVFLTFLIVRDSGKSFLSEGLDYGCLSCTAIAKISELFLQFLLLYA